MEVILWPFTLEMHQELMTVCVQITGAHHFSMWPYMLAPCPAGWAAPGAV